MPEQRALVAEKRVEQCADVVDLVQRVRENDILDSHYVMVGALEGALATGDRNVRGLWRYTSRPVS